MKTSAKLTSDLSATSEGFATKKKVGIKGKINATCSPENSNIVHWQKLMKKKPSVPGEAVSYQFLPPRGYWGGLVKKGQVIKIIDLEGNQCFDTIMYDAHSLYNRVSTSFSMIIERKWDNWKPGDGIWSRLCEKLATITADTSEGHHAFAGVFCSEAFDRVSDGISNMHSCHDNFVSAMRMAGFPNFSAADIDYGSCISVFMPLVYKPDGTMDIYDVTNEAGDYIDFIAEKDLIVTLSCCPYETYRCNAYKPSPMYAVIFKPNQDYVSKVKKLKQAKEAAYRKALGYSEDDVQTHLKREWKEIKQNE